MKRHILQFVLPAAALLGAAACSEYDIQEQFEAEFHKIAGVAESAFVASETQTFYNIDTDMTIQFHVNRGGTDPSLQATVEFEAMTDDEIADFTSVYAPLPTEFYTLPKPITFAPGEEFKTVDVHLSAAQIAALKSAIENLSDEDKPYALAIKLIGIDGTSIRSDRTCYIRPVTVEDSPALTFVVAEDHLSDLSDDMHQIVWFNPGETALTMTFTLAVGLPFDASASIAIDETAIDDFNSVYKDVVGFEPQTALTTASLDKAQIDFPAGSTLAQVTLSLDDTSVDRSRNVIIPMVFKMEQLNIERRIYAGFARSTPALTLTADMISFGPDSGGAIMPDNASFGTFPDNLIDGDPETSVTTGGNGNIWWYSNDNTYYGQSIDIDLGEAKINSLRVRFRTRSSLETLTPGNQYAYTTENGKARSHEIGLGYAVDENSEWIFLGREVVSEEKTSPTDYYSKAYRLSAESRRIRFGILRTYALDDSWEQRLWYHANDGWWAELSELEIYNAKFYEN